MEKRVPKATQAIHRTPGTVDQALLDEVVRRVVEAADPRKIILFGPAAQGRMEPGADIPLLIVAETENQHETAADIYEKLYGVGIGVTAVVTTPERMERHSDTPGLVFRHALDDGKVLYDAA